MRRILDENESHWGSRDTLDGLTFDGDLAVAIAIDLGDHVKNLEARKSMNETQAMLTAIELLRGRNFGRVERECPSIRRLRCTRRDCDRTGGMLREFLPARIS